MVKKLLTMVGSNRSYRARRQPRVEVRGDRLIVSAAMLALVFGMSLMWATPLSAAEQPGYQEHVTPDEKFRRCKDGAQALWDSINQQERESLRTIILSNPHSVDAMPSLLGLLEEGRRSEAEELVKKTYRVDDREARIITSLIGYANCVVSPEASTRP